ncbi:segregation and condensation protein A [Patescibacteria group bacterium]
MEKELELEHFSGPLDLLLRLIEEKELEITKIALADVTEQFLVYLEELDEARPEEMADFLTIATKLLLLKSYALLPYLKVEEEEDPGELEAQLRMYKKYVEAMKVVEGMLEKKQWLFPKQTARHREVVFQPPEDASGDRLRAAFIEVLQGLEPIVKLPKAAMKRVVTLREKFCQIQDKLEKNAKVCFEELLADSNNRGDVVVTFLAMLELVKKHAICVRQDKPYSDITIEKM